MDANWDDDDFDAEEVHTRHCAELARELKKAAGSCKMIPSEAPFHGDSCPWLRHSCFNLPRLSLLEYLAELPPTSSDDSSCTRGDDISRCLATRGRCIVQDIGSDLTAILRPMATCRFDVTRSSAHEFASSSLASVHVVTPRILHSEGVQGAALDHLNPAGYLTESCLLQCSAYLLQHLRNLSDLHPKLSNLLSCMFEDASTYSCTLQLVRILPLAVAADISSREQYLCHGQVEMGFISLLVALSPGAEVHIADPTEPSADWEPFRFASAAGSVSPVPGVLITGSTLERMSGVPAAPWCLMTAKPGKRTVPACLAIIRLCPCAAIATGAAANSLTVGPLMQNSLHSLADLPDRCTNSHLILDTWFAVLHFLTLRQALRTSTVARAFASAKLLAGHIAAAAIPAEDVQHLLRDSRLLQEVEVLDLTEIASLPPSFACLRAAVMAAPKLRKLSLPNWPGFKETLQRLRPNLHTILMPAPKSESSGTISKIRNRSIKGRQTSQAMQIAGKASAKSLAIPLSVHAFFGLFPSVLEDIPEWRQLQVAKALRGPRAQFMAWLQVSRRRPPLLSLEGIDVNAPIAAIASAAAVHLGLRSGVALYFDEERLDSKRSLADYGLSSMGAVRQNVQLDAVALPS